MIEEPKGLEEELENPILEPYISSEESTMAGEGEGEVHNVNGDNLGLEVEEEEIVEVEEVEEEEDEEIEEVEEEEEEEEEEEVVEEIQNLLDFPSSMKIPQPL